MSFTFFIFVSLDYRKRIFLAHKIRLIFLISNRRKKFLQKLNREWISSLGQEQFIKYLNLSIWYESLSDAILIAVSMSKELSSYHNKKRIIISPLLPFFFNPISFSLIPAQDSHKFKNHIHETLNRRLLAFPNVFTFFYFSFLPKTQTSFPKGKAE